MLVHRWQDVSSRREPACPILGHPRLNYATALPHHRHPDELPASGHHDRSCFRELRDDCLIPGERRRCRSSRPGVCRKRRRPADTQAGLRHYHPRFRAAKPARLQALRPDASRRPAAGAVPGRELSAVREQRHRERSGEGRCSKPTTVRTIPRGS
jgi:hypothetical protein